MIYSDFMKQAKELAVLRNEEIGVYYLAPDWRAILMSNGLNVKNVKEGYLTNWHDVEDVLQLEVKRRNLKEDHAKLIFDWLYNIITTNVDPKILQEENDLVKNVVEYMQLNNSLKEKEAELNEIEKDLNEKSEAAKVVPFGMDFSKKE